MAEYRNYANGRQEAAEAYFRERPEPVLIQQYEIGSKDFDSAGKASADIKFTLKRLGVDADVLRRVAVACYEAEINIVAHTKGGSITSNIHEDLIHVSFNDRGPGIADIPQAMIPGWSTADEMVREMGFGAGLGLPNIQKNSDALYINSAAGTPTVLEVLFFF